MTHPEPHHVRESSGERYVLFNCQCKRIVVYPQVALLQDADKVQLFVDHRH